MLLESSSFDVVESDKQGLQDGCNILKLIFVCSNDILGGEKKKKKKSFPRASLMENSDK